MDDLSADALAALESAGWQVQRAPERRRLPQHIRDRYRAIPEEAAAFIEGIDACVRPDETVWFLTGMDFAGESGSAFAWNEWEKLCLDGVSDEAAAEIRRFWDSHLPILHFVGGDYAYLAINVDQTASGFGSIVRGDAPDFEGVIQVAASFPDLLREVIRLAGGDVWDHSDGLEAYPTFVAKVIRLVGRKPPPRLRAMADFFGPDVDQVPPPPA